MRQATPTPAPREGLYRFARIFLALVLGIEGIDLTVTANKLVTVYPWMWVVGLVMAAGGLGYVGYELRDLRSVAPRGGTMASEPRPTIATRLLDRITGNGRRLALFPAAGVAVILADVTYNALFTGSVNNAFQGTHDTVAMLLGAVLLSYNFIPATYAKEKNFALFFAIALFGFLVVPVTLIRIFSHQAELSVDVYSSTLLAPPIVAILRAMGVYAFSSGIDLTFAVQGNRTATLAITTSCSGIYSFTIFASAFTSFVIVEFERFQVRVLGILGLGILTAYAANLLRMTIIVLVGHYTDGDDLKNALWTHANIGWVLFLIWIAVFWYAMFRVFLKDKVRETDQAFRVLDLSQNLQCVSCGEVIDPGNIPESCPACGREFELTEIEEGEAPPRPPKRSRSGRRAPERPTAGNAE